MIMAQVYREGIQSWCAYLNTNDL